MVDELVSSSNDPCLAAHHPSPIPISTPSSHSSTPSTTPSTAPSTGQSVNRRNVLLRLHKIRRLASGEILWPLDNREIAATIQMVRGIAVALDALIEDLENGRY